ncbi:oxygenase MpaB family protein [Andreprevotia chitinilytica]|uniref:oxygenase MpaB family protein n=1 Tax=Andreprevotia chitinilytica TaxID=396808 RepID=UPI001B7FF813|nr:oxygenase MpaB family protein [Andreprevotia chitinilytica]
MFCDPPGSIQRNAHTATPKGRKIELWQGIHAAVASHDFQRYFFPHKVSAIVLSRFIFNRVRSITRNGTPPVDFSTPAGDPGLFGPDSMCWRVHQDFTAMMIGGVSALMLQTLHQRALAGVWDHSNFRQDLKGRLGRTSFFIACTTYGSTQLAEEAIAHVRRVHERVKGIAPDGQAYSADDPDLLTWVHVTEASSFLNAYMKYVDPQLSIREQDQYFDEIALIALKLGATDVPRSRQAIDEYLNTQRAHLSSSDRTQEVIRILADMPPVPLNQLFIQSGFGLLPDWAQTMLGRPAPRFLEQMLIAKSVKAITPPIRWALAKHGVVNQARRRALAT